MLSKKLMVVLGAIVVLSLVMSGCVTPTPETIVETVIVEKTVEVETVVEKTVEVMVTPEPTAEPVAGPKTLVICMGQEPDNLYPPAGDMLASSHIREAVYDGPYDTRTYAYQPVILEKMPSLQDGDAIIQVVTVQEGDMVVDAGGNVVELAVDTPMKPAGCMADDCIVAFDGAPMEVDQMVVTFKFLAGLQWSNGDPLTADDSVYSFELYADPDTTSSKYTIERTVSYEAMDDVTTVWTGLPGLIDSTYFLNVWSPFPRKLWQEELGYTAADLNEAEESSRMPMGWGAFVIKEWVAGDHITVEKNPLYFRADEGLPYVDTVIYRFVADSNAAVAQLISGECDIATQDASLEDQADLLLKLEQQQVLNPLFVTGTAWEHLDFGINPVPEYDRPDFFEDVRTRQAVAYCLDHQSVIDTLLYGRSIQIGTYIPPEHPLYNPDIVMYPYDPDAGMALLEAVGWVDADGDGVREASGVEGVPTARCLNSSGNPPPPPCASNICRSTSKTCWTAVSRSIWRT
jgi:peptide/nickel transport system substrate-binding protein